MTTPLAIPETLGLDDLRDLMQVMTETSSRLEATHERLHQEVARLKSELAGANAALRRSRDLAALGEMAAGIAHEVRNPLGSIQLYVQCLGEDLADRPEQAALCAKIERAVIGLDAIVRDVLHFARDTTLRPAPVRPADLLERAVDACRAPITAAAAVVETAIDPGADATFQADGTLLVQALTNLVRNAVDAVREHRGPGGRIVLRAQRRHVRLPGGGKAPRVVLAVEDDGPGIAEAVRSRLFNPFFTTRPSGTGLGLAIVHRIVDAHGGHVHARNLDSAGASLELYLPPAPPRGDDPEHDP